MAFAAIASGAIPATIATGTSTNAAQTVTQDAQQQKNTPVVVNAPVRAIRRTPIGTAIPRPPRLLGTIPQKHAKHRTNRLKISKATKRKHRRA